MNGRDRTTTAGRISDERLAERRVLFGPLAEALAALALDGPIAFLGTPRSLSAVRDGGRCWMVWS